MKIGYFSRLKRAQFVILEFFVISVSFYDVIYMPDSKPDSKPSLALCLPMPFEAQKLRSLGVSSELASFMLYTLSPYYPNPDILDNSKLLTDLTGQYR